MVEIVKEEGDYLGLLKRYEFDEPAERRWLNQRGKKYIAYQVGAWFTLAGLSHLLSINPEPSAGLFFLSVPACYYAAKKRAKELVNE